MTPTTAPFGNLFSADDVILLFFYLLIGVYAVFTAIFYYHWRTYSTDGRINLITFVSFFVITIPLIMTMAAVVAL